jgi:aspartyl-tRNA(Asn)/glutamyl-tRNA(Gln) amidotransferase subunit A
MTPETIEGLATALRRGELTSEALVGRAIARATAAEPVLGAFVAVAGEHALAQARAADAERRSGLDRGPLHGIPVAVKDVIDVARLPTTGGSRLYERNFAAADAAVVTRLIAAGAVILGKTRLVELGYGGWGTNSVAGTPRNPWDLARHRAPGGSSSGSAVAVSARLVPAALGTDTGGSVRIPAALCGVVGLRTSAGSVPLDGVMPLSRTLDTVGPLALTVRDAAVVHAALTGAPPPRPGPPPARPRVGILTAGDVDDVDADVLAGYDDAIGWLAGAGASLAEFGFAEGLDTYVERMHPIIGHEAWGAHGLRILQAGADVMDPPVRARFLAGQRVTPPRYRDALRERTGAAAQAAAALAGFDAVLTPATPITAPPLEDVDEDALPLSRYTRVVSYLGLCALAVPAGLGSNGMPVAVQLVGRAGTEERLLALGAALEAQRGPFPAPDLAALGLP